MSVYNFSGKAVLAVETRHNAGVPGGAPFSQMKRLLPIFTAATVLACLTAAAPANAAIGVAPAREFVPRQVVVKFAGARSARTVGLPRGVDVKQGIAAFGDNPRVAYAQPNYVATASAVRSSADAVEFPDDPGTIPGTGEPPGKPGGWAFRQWNFLPWESSEVPGLPTSPGGIDATEAWRQLEDVGRPGGLGVTVAVLDTGVAYGGGHGFKRSPDFDKTFFAPGYDFVNEDRRPQDENGHGTHVAGTIAARNNNGVGMTGLAYGAAVMPVQVLDKFGRGRASKIAKGIEFATEHGAEVINMSFNFGCGKRVIPVEDALRKAYAKGVITVASVGNVGSEVCISEPATGPHVIGVGGTTEGGCLGDYSLSGTEVDLVAPGGGSPIAGCPSVLSRPIFQVTLKPGSKTEFAIPSDYVGTSMAAAHVSGVAALVLASGVIKKSRRARPTVRVHRVTQRLRHTARDIGLPRTQQGAGLLDAAAATAPTAAGRR
jgi:serine protease